MNRTKKVLGSHATATLAGALLILGFASVGCSAPAPTEEKGHTRSKFGRIGPVGGGLGRTWGNAKLPGRGPLPRTPDQPETGRGTDAQEACKGSAENCAPPDGSSDNPYPYNPNFTENENGNQGGYNDSDYAQGSSDGYGYGYEEGWDSADTGGGFDCFDCG